MNARSKGLLWCNEVRKILISRGHTVDGPFFKAKWFNGRTGVIHEDIFGVWDLVSFSPAKHYIFHQVTDMPHRSEHQRKIDDLGLSGYVWCRCKVKNRVKYRVFLNGCEIGDE